LSTLVSYPNLIICSQGGAVCSWIAPAVALDLRGVVIGIFIAVIVACIIFAGLMVTREEKTANEPTSQKTSLAEALPMKVAEKTAAPKEAKESIETWASEETTRGKVLWAPPQTTTAESITEAEEMVLPGTRLKVEEPSRKGQLWERLIRRYQQIIVPLDIADLRIIPDEAGPGESVNISFKVTNMNDVPGNCLVTLRINGAVMATKGISLSQKAAAQADFPVVVTLPGDYRVEVNGLTGRFTILGEMQQTFPCPKCGMQNYVSRQFCEGCGAKLFVRSQLQAYGNSKESVCHICGKPVVYGDEFCGSCGASLKWPTQQKMQHPPV
jgi:hypothetical protein